MSGRHKSARARGRPGRGPAPSNPPRLDAVNLAGITQLMNPQNLRVEADLDEAEQTVMGRSGPPAAASKAAADPIEIYNRELGELAEELGIDFLEGGGADNSDSDTPKAKTAGLAPAPPRPAPKVRDLLGGSMIDNLIGDLDLGSDSDASSGSSSDLSDGSESDVSSASNYSSSYESEGSNSSYSDTSGSEESADSSESEASDDDTIRSLEKELGIDLAAAQKHGKRRRRVHAVPVVSGRRSRLEDLTEEQERRRHIDAVMGNMRTETRTSFGVEQERVQDAKASKLEQIGQLRMTLEEEGVDCKGVGEPTMESPVGEIDSVLAILKLKNDRNRYSSLAEEVILGVAEGIETVFDGTREVPVVGWKPDYTGYHNTVNVKLHRMRFETSQVVGNVIEKHNIGPSARIVMELLPSFFLYPRQQSKQRSSPGLHADFGGAGGQGDARSAYSAIRRADAPDSVASLDNI